MEQFEAIDKLWDAADALWANTNIPRNDYFRPVMGLIFLRQAYSRFLAVRAQILASLPAQGVVSTALPEPTKADFSHQGALYLRPEARFDYLVGLKNSEDRAQAIITAMTTIEADYPALQGTLPKAEYQALDNTILGDLLRALNREDLQQSSGAVFGRIYESFYARSTNSAVRKGRGCGAFYTPAALLQTLAHFIAPETLDPRFDLAPASQPSGR